MIQIIFSRRKCIGCNACVEAAKDRWRISRTDGKSILLAPAESVRRAKNERGIYRVSLQDDEYGRNLKAAGNCPVKIIKVEKH